MSAVAALLADGRLHLQHGPIDCLCRAWGPADEVQAAYRQAAAAFDTVLDDLCAELALLRTPLPAARPRGAVAAAMHAACLPYAADFITPMAAVAGAVADHVLAALCAGRRLDRAFVNNGGDIAFHLAPGHQLRCGLVGDLAAPGLDGVLVLSAAAAARGIATSGRACKGHGGRSFSFGIADAVSVLARDAATADAAASMIGNAVDLPGHPAIRRLPACAVDPDSDLGARAITWEVGLLSDDACAAALDSGRRMADGLLRAGLIEGAVLTLRGQISLCGAPAAALELA
ncbi:MAG: UPF0280 family protein [Rhodospirillales bacterium]|nr:UPF0280 family protein [Rhodospirillales bacterium]MDE2576536.1 UPF0280 family protein [Rhodospirillales bacterium]